MFDKSNAVNCTKIRVLIEYSSSKNGFCYSASTMAVFKRQSPHLLMIPNSPNSQTGTI